VGFFLHARMLYLRVFTRRVVTQQTEATTPAEPPVLLLWVPVRLCQGLSCLCSPLLRFLQSLVLHSSLLLAGAPLLLQSLLLQLLSKPAAPAACCLQEHAHTAAALSQVQVPVLLQDERDKPQPQPLIDCSS
jgi:hypothetical protein